MRNRIREMREIRGLTQRELAVRVGIRQPNLCDIERGRYTPGLPLAFRLSDALDCGVRELFAFDYGPPKERAEDTQGVHQPAKGVALDRCATAPTNAREGT